MVARRGRTGISFDMRRATERLTQSQHGYKAVLLKSSEEAAKDGEKVLRLMVPFDTGSLENAVRGEVVNHKGAGVELSFYIDPNARNKKTGRPIIKYAEYLDGNKFTLGKKSAIKDQQNPRFKVGTNFMGRVRDFVNRGYKDKLISDMKKAGFKGRWK